MQAILTVIYTHLRKFGKDYLGWLPCHLSFGSLAILFGYLAINVFYIDLLTDMNINWWPQGPKLKKKHIPPVKFL